MNFTCETEYNAKTMTLMAKVLRKTIRQKQSRRSHLFGWITAVLGLAFLVWKGFTFDFRTILTLTAVVVVTTVLLFEDKLNGSIAQKRLLPGTERATTVFFPTHFVSTTEVGKTEWNYNKIQLLAETEDAFVFIFSPNHGQVYDKNHLQGGTSEDFRRFIEDTTQKTVQVIR